MGARKVILPIIFSLIIISSASPSAFAGVGVCFADNVGGTVQGPLSACSYESAEPLVIVDGLPPGNVIEIQATFLPDYPPGSIVLPIFLNEEREITTELIQMELTGFGPDLAGFNRMLFMNANFEAESDPRTPGDPVQVFPTELMNIQGAIFGDPDFDSLQLTIGRDFGLPSPGQTTLTDIGGGKFEVDSFFDIAYQIDFVGAPGSVLNELSGSTQSETQIGEIPGGDPPRPVGGVGIPVDSTALLLASVQSISLLMIPVIAGIVIGAFFIKKRF